MPPVMSRDFLRFSQQFLTFFQPGVLILDSTLVTAAGELSSREIRYLPSIGLHREPGLQFLYEKR
jgi:hypothetical protein